MYVTCTPSEVTKTISTGVPAGNGDETIHLNVTVAVLLGGMVLGALSFVLLAQIRVPLVNSSSPRVIEVEGLLGGL